MLHKCHPVSLLSECLQRWSNWCSWGHWQGFLFFSVLWTLVFLPWLRLDKKAWVNNWENRQAALEPAAYQKLFAWKYISANREGNGTKKYYHRYEMFLLNTQIEVKLCCFCFSIYILIRLSKDMQGGDEQHFRKLFQYFSGSSILTKVYWALWCGRCWLIGLKSWTFFSSWTPLKGVLAKLSYCSHERQSRLLVQLGRGKAMVHPKARATIPPLSFHEDKCLPLLR